MGVAESHARPTPGALAGQQSKRIVANAVKTVLLALYAIVSANMIVAAEMGHGGCGNGIAGVFFFIQVPLTVLAAIFARRDTLIMLRSPVAAEQLGALGRIALAVVGVVATCRPFIDF